MKITEPGIYRGVLDADYRADPTPIPSLTQSAVKTLIERSPWHAWVGNQRLNPNFEPDDDTKFDLGNVSHLLLLGRGKEIEVIQFDDWRKKAAQEAREEAAAAGKIAVLEHQFDQALEMTKAAKLQIASHEDDDAFAFGQAEVMIAWEEDGIWFRSLIDWLHNDLRTVDDFKSTGMSVAPHLLGMRAQSAGWEIQAAFIERGLNILDPDRAGRRRFRFIAQETGKPYALSVMHMDEHWLTMGRKKIEVGIAMWRNALKTGKWHGYPSRSIIPDYPGFKESQWLDREMSGEFEPDPKLIMAG